METVHAEEKNMKSISGMETDMDNREKILIESGIGEYEEKKSKFIAHLKEIESEEDAIAYINALKKEYWDARHNCYAYILGERNEIQRFSDDGEPGGTAGKPILDVIAGSGLRNVVMVVTRYFGGVLLGTGGLVRAYQKSSIDAIERSVVIDKLQGIRINVTTDYTGIGKLQYLVATLDASEMNTEYGENVNMDVIVPVDNYNKFVESITEATSGKAVIDKTGDVCYGIHKGKTIVV